MSQIKKVEVRASIDLGSSYFRLLVVKGTFPSGGMLGVTEAFSDKRFIGWGEDVQASGCISPDRLSLAERSLVELVHASGEHGCDAPVLVGTNVLRKAGNARDAVRRLSRAVSLPVRILSSMGEAAKGFLGSAAHLPHAVPLILIDPGGTSTEISWGVGSRFQDCTSIQLGTHRIAGRLGPRERQRMRACNIAAITRRRFAGVLGEVPRVKDVSRLSRWHETPTIIATGGTAVSLAVLKRFMNGAAPLFSEMDLLTADDLVLIGRRLSGLFARGHERRIPLDRGRIGLIVPGLLMISMLVERMGIDCFCTTARDLRWGVVLSNGSFAEDEIIGGGIGV